MTQPKYVYFFGPGESEGDTTMRLYSVVREQTLPR